MIIDTHGHISLCPEVLAYKSQIGSSRLNPDVGPMKIPDARLYEFGLDHIKKLDKVGTDVQLISPRPFHAWHAMKPHKVVVEWSRFVNEIIARTVAMFPDRYIGVCGLPQGPDEPLDTAVFELERCVREYGFVGCLINPDPAEGGFPTPPGLGDKFWYPLYEKMCELDVPALVHSASCMAERESYTLHFINEESIAIVSLLESDVFKDFPDLKIQISHGGGAIPYQYARFESWRSKANASERFVESMRRLWYDTCVYDARGLELLFRTVGTDRCAFGTELPGTGTADDRDSSYPRQFDDIRPLIENDIPWLTEADKRLILEEVPRSLYKLKV